MLFETDSRTLEKLKDKAEKEGVEVQQLLEDFANDDYLEQSARTASSELHDEIVSSTLLRAMISQAIVAGRGADAVKKSLFYGEDLKYTGLDYDPSIPDMNLIPADILHGALGLFTESVEILEAVLTGLQGGGLDDVNLLEELGDSEWYMAMLYRAINRKPADAKRVNLDKLKKRYPEKFESEQAINRDTGAERIILEDGFNKNK